MMAFKKVMIALARDAGDASLLLIARQLVLAEAPEVLHAVTVEPDGLAGACFPDETAAVAIEREVRATLGALPGTTIMTTLLRGDLLDALLSYSNEHGVDLLLVGHRRSRASRELARRLARSARCSVWMVPDGVAPRISRVLVPVDFSDASGHALDAALDLCRAFAIPECLAVNVYSVAGPRDENEERRLRTDDEHAAEIFLRARDTSGVTVRALFEQADEVVAGVLRVVAREGVDLVCMSSRGRSRTAAVLLGSATEDVMGAVSCPVLVIRAPGHPLNFIQVLARRVFTEEDRPRLG